VRACPLARNSMFNIADTVQAAYLSGIRAAGEVRAFLEGAARATWSVSGRTA
jgi:hypothetical protein